jgi:hypothetical protein
MTESMEGMGERPPVPFLRRVPTEQRIERDFADFQQWCRELRGRRQAAGPFMRVYQVAVGPHYQRRFIVWREQLRFRRVHWCAKPVSCPEICIREPNPGRLIARVCEEMRKGGIS